MSQPFLTVPERQLVDKICCDPVSGNIRPYGALAVQVVRILRSLVALQIADVARPRPGKVIEQITGQAALRFHTETIVLMAGAVSGVINGRIIREWSRLVDVQH